MLALAVCSRNSEFLLLFFFFFLVVAHSKFGILRHLYLKEHNFYYPDFDLLRTYFSCSHNEQ